MSDVFLFCGPKMVDMFIALEVFLSLTHKKFDSFQV